VLCLVMSHRQVQSTPSRCRETSVLVSSTAPLSVFQNGCTNHTTVKISDMANFSCRERYLSLSRSLVIDDTELLIASATTSDIARLALDTSPTTSEAISMHSNLHKSVTAPSELSSKKTTPANCTLTDCSSYSFIPTCRLQRARSRCADRTRHRR